MGMSRTMKSIITWVICLVVLAGVAVGGYFAYKATEKPRDPAPQTGALVVSHGELRDKTGKVIDLSQPLVVGDIYQVVNENEEGFSFKVNPENEGHETSITGVVGEAETLKIPGAMEINKDTYEVVSIEENVFTEATSLKNLYVADSIDTTSSNLSASFELQSASDVEGYDLYIKSVVVSFNANGGICETTSNELISGEVYGELPVPTRTGYTFDGWYTALENGTKVESSTLVTATEDHTLYANWTAITYNVVLNENGGNNVDDLTYTVETTTLTLPTLTREGYTFNGWFTAEVAGTKVESTDILSKLENQTYYAQWTPEEYDVILDENGGDLINDITYTIESEDITLPTPTRDGYTFIGWFGVKVVSGTTYYVGMDFLTTNNNALAYTSLDEANLNDANKVVAIDCDVFAVNIGSGTLIAKWEEIVVLPVTVEITFNANGGSVNPSTTTLTVGEAYGTLPTPTRDGYAFDGWYTAETNGDLIISTTIVEDGENHTLYAHWTIVDYVVILNANGGEEVEGLTFNINTTTLALPTLTRDGYTFNGWFTAEVGGTKVEPTDILSKLENQQYYAQWTPEEYDVILDENGGDLINDITYTIESEDITLPTPTRDGYTFIGWFGVKVVSGTTYYVGMDFLTTNNNALAYTSLDEANLNDTNKVVAIDCDVFAVNIGSGTLIAKWINATAPTVSILRTDHNTFSWTAFDNIGVAGYAITNSSTAPTSDWITTGTLTSGTKDIYTANTWYVWVKDTDNNIGFAKITSHELKENEGKRTNIAIRCNEVDGPMISNENYEGYVLAGTPIYITVTAKTGYNTPSVSVSGATKSEDAYIVFDDVSVVGSAKCNQYTITFDNRSATVEGTKSIVVYYGLTLPEITVPTRTGYKFGGYYTEINGGGTRYYNEDGVGTEDDARLPAVSLKNWDIASDVTLYAKWTPSQNVVTLNKQGGSGGTSTILATYDKIMPEITVPTKEGYVFGGYFTKTGGKGIQYYNADGSSARNWDTVSVIVLYAKWTKV